MYEPYQFSKLRSKISQKVKLLYVERNDREFYGFAQEKETKDIVLTEN